MTKLTDTRGPARPLSLVPVALLLIWWPSLGAPSGLQNEPGWAPKGPLPPPSYESFFGRQAPVEAESPEWRIELSKTESSPECPSQFLFQVRNKESGANSHFTICNGSLQVDEVDIISGTRALILSRASANFPEATVVELPSGKVVDHFASFRPALSRDHHLLAFLKDFPGHPGPVEITDEYIVYDLTRSATYNRPQFKPGVTYDTGWPVYPLGATNAAGENILPQGSPYHSLASQRLFWLGHYTLAFADFFEGQNRLVVVSLSHGVKDPEVRTLDLDPTELVDLDRCKKASAPSDFERWSKQPAGLIHIEQIDPVPGNPGMACLYFVPSPCLRYTSLRVNLP